ncbi:hypothetical protein C8F01DRAFT_1310980 [Mycena amicta]|nr:hypothetical protein C8F01DRAFT_1310980 [Mycena amicta]
MPQPALPQELLDGILEHITDGPTLKSCAISGSRLRDTSQKILLHSLRLGDLNARRVSALLDTSPHLAGYLTHLYIDLPQAHTKESDWNALREVLMRLHSVRVCILDGDPSWDVFHWKDVPDLFAKSLWSFLDSQELLAELHLLTIQNIPLPSFIRLLGAARTLSVYYVSIDAKVTTEIPFLSGYHCLALQAGGAYICDSLAGPAFSTLSYLSLEYRVDYIQAIVAALSNMSESLQVLHLQYYSNASIWKMYGLPQFPVLRALRRLHFDLDVGIRDLSKTIHVHPADEILSPSSNTPNLAQIIITVRVLPRGTADSSIFRHWSLDTSLLRRLDDTVAAHPAVRSLRWMLPQSLMQFEHTIIENTPRLAGHNGAAGVLEIHSDEDLNEADSRESLRAFKLPYQLLV